MQTALQIGIWPYEAAVSANNFAPFPMWEAKKRSSDLFSGLNFGTPKGGAAWGKCLVTLYFCSPPHAKQLNVEINSKNSPHVQKSSNVDCTHIVHIIDLKTLRLQIILFMEEKAFV